MNSNEPPLFETTELCVPLRLSNILGWAKATARRDLRYRYETGLPPAPINLRNIAASLVPSLRHPVFIIGAARSGTTFLGDAIGQMPGFSYHHEPIATKAATGNIYRGEWSDHLGSCFFHSVFRWLLRINRTGGKRFSQKTPRHCFIVPFLAKAFPGCKIIHIIRDGRDAALSNKRKGWLCRDNTLEKTREEGGYLNGPYPRFWCEPGRENDFFQTSDLHRCLWAWRRYVESARKDLLQLPRTRWTEVRYESLVEDPVGHSRQLADFMEIDSEIDRTSLNSAMKSASCASIGAWRSAYSEQDRDLADKEIGPTLQLLGYSV